MSLGGPHAAVGSWLETRVGTGLAPNWCPWARGLPGLYTGHVGSPEGWVGPLGHEWVLVASRSPCPRLTGLSPQERSPAQSCGCQLLRCPLRPGDLLPHRAPRKAPGGILRVSAGPCTCGRAWQCPTARGGVQRWEIGGAERGLAWTRGPDAARGPRPPATRPSWPLSAKWLLPAGPFLRWPVQVCGDVIG